MTLLREECEQSVYMKKCLASLVIKEMQIKMTIKDIFHPQNDKIIGKEVEP